MMKARPKTRKSKTELKPLQTTRAQVPDVQTGTSKLKIGLADMLKGGVIMDVTNAEQAKIAEDAGAVSVMALERVPADIRAQGGVARIGQHSQD
jgi:pyridoxal 5'-phosphate synthase pdxS subunit